MTTATLNYPYSTTQAHAHEQAGACTDDVIMQAFSSGKHEWAMEQLYSRYKQYMEALAYRILGDSYLAEDVVQDVFCMLWYKACAYQKELGSVKGWLQAIVRNRAIDKVRSSMHREYQFAHLQTEDGPDPSSPEPEMWEQVWDGEQAGLIRKALAQLPPEQRRVIEMNYFSGYTHVEIASKLQIPIGTVKGRARLGLQKVKQLLQQYGLDTSA